MEPLDDGGFLKGVRMGMKMEMVPSGMRIWGMEGMGWGF